MSAAHPSSLTPVDTRVMNLLHTVYRREFRLAAGVVRGVADGDTGRAAVVADHLRMVTRHLHDHHTTEDQMLWPMLLERVPEELAPIVHLMESQHEHVDRLMDDLDPLLTSWRQHARADDRDRLATVLDALYVHLVEHLDAEEQRLLPIAARNLSQEEWDALGEVGRSKVPRKERSLVFGMFGYDGDPEVLASMLADAPAPVRWLVPRLGRRAYARHAARVYGTATP
jgi:hemerythrin-like domain-containing protein